jgi:hypothetical protein
MTMMHENEDEDNEDNEDIYQSKLASESIVTCDRAEPVVDPGLP